ncbi:MAG: HepT-like ribonuclease domain-containing protein [Burkholderiales bacterium]
MHAEDRMRLRHMVDAAEHAMQFVAGRQRVDLENDRMLLFALVRAIEVIGEAAGRVSDDTKAAYADVPWKAIIGMRNRLIHAYFDIDTETVWTTATAEIPAILPKLRVLAAGE